MDQSLDANGYVQCQVCKIAVKTKNLRKHNAREHSPEGIARKEELKKRKAAAKPKKMFAKANDKKLLPKGELIGLSSGLRKRKLDALDKPDREWSTDVMDRSQVFSGGGYGLGRNRKH